ncbi:sensor histidine kinase [Paenibacillus sp. TRM 82003]|nr:sensor histidine kinase [Paenibacillus sp. TRM 82003]
MNIKTKLFIVLVAVSIVPIIVVSLFSYRNYTKLVNEQTALVASTTIEDSVKSIETIMHNINRISITFQRQSSNAASYTTVTDELKRMQETEDTFELFLIRNRLKLIFENLLLGYDYINGIYLFTPDGKFISYGSGTDLRVGYNPIGDAWYERTIANKGELYIGDIDTKSYIINAKPSIAFSRALYDSSSGEYLGVFMLDCSLDIFEGLDRSFAPNISNVYLANGNGTILFDGTRNEVGQVLPESLLELSTRLEKNGQVKHYDPEYLTVMQSVPSNDWRVIARVSVDELYKAYGISQQLIVYVSVSCAVIFLLLSVVLSNLITKPIIQLTRIMRKNKGQNIAPANLPADRQDEISILYKEYDKMMREIESHIRESYQNRILTLDSQMKALEAQINSHFLYNTLESINSIAEVEEVESIAVMTKALGDMFRYSIKTESEIVSLAEEIQHVDNYMAIQLIRYGDKITFRKHIQVETRSSKILKLLLQPLVENAIYHGLENKRGGGTITLTGYRDEQHLVFEIIDDGVGMSREQAEELRSFLEQPPEFLGIGQRNKRSIGIKNVHSRISLYYGTPYGIRFDSMPGTGTKMTVVLPFR